MLPNLPLFLFIFLNFDKIVVKIDGLVTCEKCEFGNADCSPCRGDYCYRAEYFYSNENTVTQLPTVISGCVIGEISEIYQNACQINNFGNQICFCHDGDYCNSNLNATTVTRSTTVIPVQTCQPEKIDNLPRPRWVRPCAANFCTFIGSTTDTNYTWSIKDCNKENEFSFFPTLTVFNFMPGTCVWLNYGGVPDGKVCYGADNLPATATFDATLAVTNCHVDYFNPRVPYFRTGAGQCRGQFCFISATSRGEVFRGCANSTTVDGAIPLKIGYTRSYTGLEQWLCSEDYCNADLKSAELSWPPELYLYRNISNLREFNVFYINSAGLESKIFFAIFFLIFFNF